MGQALNRKIDGEVEKKINNRLFDYLLSFKFAAQNREEV